MKTGVIVLARDQAKDRVVAEECADYLISKGRKNVRTAFYLGDEKPEDLMRSMYHEGIDTFVVLPLVISEGRHSVWLMPKSVLLPDNYGSWTMLDGKDVALRFATALGADSRMADELLSIAGEPEDNSAALLVSYGSPFSYANKDMEYYAQRFKEKGWCVQRASLTNGISLEDAVEKIVQQGKDEVKVIPFFVSPNSDSFKKVKGILNKYQLNVTYLDTVTAIPIYKEILNSKVPEGW